ncbi:MAG: hypothetical protein O9302_14360 [Cyclobacteriaceae bacterium]|jgi:hypothetical protein|nr:hypothetical protein [Cytophagales bacterium]MCZ8329246.1 hypothetical protein [Cyclobacteriaceae bacterium]
MMKKENYTFLSVLFCLGTGLLLWACAGSKPVSTAQEIYVEDVSKLKPTFSSLPAIETLPVPIASEKKYVPANNTINAQLKQIQDSIDYFYVGRKFVDGFTIQVYVGQKKEEAMQAKKSLDINLPQLKAEMVFTQPTFKVKAGRYYSLLDAQKDYVNVKRIFPNAILVPDKLPIQ